MDKNLTIIALIVVILVLMMGILFAMPNLSKTGSKLEIMGSDTLNEGDVLQIKLTDSNGTALANQTVNITINDKDKTSEYNSVITNDEGVGELKFEKGPGEYDVTVSFEGNGRYNGCNVTKKITVNNEEVVEEQTTQRSTQSSSLPYSIDNLPPSNDPYPEVSRHQEGDYVFQDYEDGYRSIVNLRTGERTSGGFR